jgi:hypothetical protein
MFWNGASFSKRGGVWLLLVRSPLLGGLTAAPFRSPVYNLGADRTQNTASNSSFIVTCLFCNSCSTVASASAVAKTCLQRRYLATDGSSGSAIQAFRGYVTIFTIKFTAFYESQWYQFNNEMKRSKLYPSRNQCFVFNVSLARLCSSNEMTYRSMWPVLYTVTTDKYFCFCKKHITTSTSYVGSCS